MANYLEMSTEELQQEESRLRSAYQNYKNMGLKLNMARGKPGPHQMDLAMDLFKTTDYTAADGTDARNYGNLEGLYEYDSTSAAIEKGRCAERDARRGRFPARRERRG